MAPTIPDEQILNAALDVIADQGYAGATTREIAAAAGINEVTLFRRFGTKKRLLMAAVEQEAEKYAVAGIEYTGDLEGDLSRIVRFYRDLAENRRHVIVMLLAETRRQPELLEVMETPFSITRQMSAILARYQQEGALIEEPPLSAFVALVGPLFLGGVMGLVEAGAGEERLDPSSHVRRYLQGRARGGWKGGLA